MGGTVINNSVINVGGNPGISSGPLALRPAQTFDGHIYIANDTANLAIYQYSKTLAAWQNLTAGGGGGGGTLQSVMAAGNATVTNYLGFCDPGDELLILLNGAPGIDGRAVGLIASDAEDAGVLFFQNKNGAHGYIKANLIDAATQVYELPAKGGTDQILACISDLPVNLNNWLLNETGTANITTVSSVSATSIKNGSNVNFSVCLVCQPTLAATTSRITIILPYANSNPIGDPLCCGSLIDTVTSVVVPVYVVNIGASASIVFTAPSSNSCKLVIDGTYFL